MTEPLHHRVDGEIYLERQRRMRRAMEGPHIDPREIVGILAEAHVDFVTGRRYRVRTVAGPPEVRHVHGIDDAGREHAIDMIRIKPDRIEWQELELVFLGRITSGACLFAMGDGHNALLGDMDILQADELADVA